MQILELLDQAKLDCIESLTVLRNTIWVQIFVVQHFRSFIKL